MTDDATPGTGLYGLADRFLRALELIAILIAAVMLLATMILISADAGMRYLFKAPLLFQLTLTEDYLLVGLIMMALPWGFRTGGYIRIPAVPNLLPAAPRVLLLRAGLMLSAGYAALLTWQSWGEFWAAFISGHARLGVIDYPVWLSHIWVPTGLGLLSLRLMMVAIGPRQNLHIEHDPIEEV